MNRPHTDDHLSFACLLCLTIDFAIGAHSWNQDRVRELRDLRARVEGLERRHGWTDEAIRREVEQGRKDQREAERTMRP